MYDLGKVSEVLTADAALRLVDSGKIALNDPISRYLKGLPQAWQEITVQQLLVQTSGLPEFLLDKETFEQALEQAATKPLAYKPGTKHSYRSSNFELLGKVIAVATETKYTDAMSATLFKSLKMDNTGDLQKLVRWHLRLASSTNPNATPNLTRSFGACPQLLPIK